MARQLCFSFDARFCTGCHTCQVACDDAKGRLASGGLSAKRPFRRVTEAEEGDFLREGLGFVPRVRITHASEACRHCASPACLAACPAGAISKRASDGIVLVDPSLCSGCGECEAACPFGCVAVDAESGKAEKCDFCLSELEAGRPPVCVASCPMRALGYGYGAPEGGAP